MSRGRAPSGTEVRNTPAFSLGVQKFGALGQGFVPNATAESAGNSDGSYYAWVMDRDSAQRSGNESADLARSYRDADVPEEVYDFELAGYGLYRGRVDETPGGSAITGTGHRGEK